MHRWLQKYPVITQLDSHGVNTYSRLDCSYESNRLEKPTGIISCITNINYNTSKQTENSKATEDKLDFKTIQNNWSLQLTTMFWF